MNTVSVFVTHLHYQNDKSQVQLDQTWDYNFKDGGRETWLLGYAI